MGNTFRAKSVKPPRALVINAGISKNAKIINPAQTHKVKKFLFDIIYRDVLLWCNMKIKKEKFPILEYDPTSPPVVQPKNYLPKFVKQKCNKCLVTYFSDVVELYERVYKLNQVFKVRTEGVRPRVFLMKAGPSNEFIYVVPMAIGAPEAARVIETMNAVGVEKFMVCGGAGTLDDAVTQGKVLIPTSALRDEGTSYHYLTPSREVALNPKVQKVIESVLGREKEPYAKVKTWTTDAIFRETADKVALRKKEGCITVEMECAA